MDEYNYIIKKIQHAEIEEFPFKHVYIENFLKEEDFIFLIKNEKINIPKQNDTKQLIEYLLSNDYKSIKFPGCTSDIQEYLSSNEQTGLALQLNYNFKLLNFLNGKDFHKCLCEKFNIQKENLISTTIQKYLSGYRISPHPDTRTKALAYMININTNEQSENINIHTNLLTFKEEYKYIQKFWQENENYDRCWLPWNYCEIKKTICKNNSIILFKPDNDTLHSVNLKYDHLNFQRTQIYGNLWYSKTKQYKNIHYNDITH